MVTLRVQGPGGRVRAVNHGGSSITPPSRVPRPPAERGQSLTEFALVIPFLLVILLTVADFARFFATGIQVESMARTAAETTAWQVTDQTGDTFSEGYAALHEHAWTTVCDEAKPLANVVYHGVGVQCDNIATVVCIHDSGDTECANAYNVFTPGPAIPAGCPTLDVANRPTNAQAGSGEGVHRWVEVRVCYRFDTIFGFDIPFIGGVIPLLSGDFYIERTRTFTVADY